jgi:hypothetical protein
MRRIAFLRQELEKSLVVTVVPMKASLLEQFESLEGTFKDFMERSYADWNAVSRKHFEFGYKVQQNLLTRRDSWNLMITFDRDLARDLAEQSYWAKLKFDSPTYLVEWSGKRDTLRRLNDGVVSVVMRVNLISEHLTEEELKIFRENMSKLDRLLTSAMASLTWRSNSRQVEQFISQALREADAVLSCINLYAQLTADIYDLCVEIRRTVLCDVDSKRVSTVDEFEEYQADVRIKAKSRLNSLNRSISQKVQEIRAINSNDGIVAKSLWNEFLLRIDRVVEEALRDSVTTSALSFYRAISSERNARESSSPDINPILCVNLILDNQKVEISPSLTELEVRLNRVARDMIGTEMKCTHN